MSFKLGHISIPKRRIFLPLFLFFAYDSSVPQNFKIFTHLLPNFSYKDPWLTEVTYHCINFKDRVRKVPYLNFGELSYRMHKAKTGAKKMRLLGMDTCPSLNDIMEINVFEASRGTIFKHAELHALWIISIYIRVDTCNLMLT
jgi:hypothetical protein